MYTLALLSLGKEFARELTIFIFDSNVHINIFVAIGMDYLDLNSFYSLTIRFFTFINIILFIFSKFPIKIRHIIIKINHICVSLTLILLCFLMLYGNIECR